MDIEKLFECGDKTEKLAKDLAENYDYEMAMASICMMLELYCKLTKRNIKEEVAMMYLHITTVNEELGDF